MPHSRYPIRAFKRGERILLAIVDFFIAWRADFNLVCGTPEPVQFLSDSWARRIRLLIGGLATKRFRILAPPPPRPEIAIRAAKAVAGCC